MRQTGGLLKAADSVINALSSLTDVVLSCYVSFFVTLFMHSMDRDYHVRLMKKQKDAEMDASIQILTSSIARLDNNIALLKTTVATHSDTAGQRYKTELESVESQRSSMQYLLTSLRGRLDVCKLLPAVNVISKNIGVQLDASSYINKKVLTLSVQRDLGDKQYPTVEASVSDVYETYNLGHTSDAQLV